MLVKLSSPPQARKFAILGCTQAGFVNNFGQKIHKQECEFWRVGAELIVDLRTPLPKLIVDFCNCGFSHYLIVEIWHRGNSSQNP